MQEDPWCSNKRRLTKPHYQDLGPKVAGQRLCLPLEHQEQEGKPGERTPELMTAEKRDKKRNKSAARGRRVGKRKLREGKSVPARPALRASRGSEGKCYYFTLRVQKYKGTKDQKARNKVHKNQGTKGQTCLCCALRGAS